MTSSSKQVWIAICGYNFEVGPPLQGVRGTRWFTDEVSEDQMWLPFKKYAPAPVLCIYDNNHASWGEGFVVCYKYKTHEREALFNINQTERRGHLRAFAAYYRVEVPSNPFTTTDRHHVRQPLRRSLPQLDELLRHNVVQLAIEREVGAAFGTPMYLSVATGHIRRSGGVALADVQFATYNADQRIWTIVIRVFGSLQRLNVFVPAIALEGGCVETN